MELEPRRIVKGHADGAVAYLLNEPCMRTIADRTNFEPSYFAKVAQLDDFVFNGCQGYISSRPLVGHRRAVLKHRSATLSTTLDAAVPGAANATRAVLAQQRNIYGYYWNHVKRRAKPLPVFDDDLPDRHDAFQTAVYCNLAKATTTAPRRDPPPIPPPARKESVRDVFYRAKQILI